METPNHIFSRNELLLGQDVTNRIQHTRVIIFGVGGVGSWCAESLVRSGIQHLTLVDFDDISVTNVNRQLMATTKTVGRVKAEVLKERLLDIYPEAQIDVLATKYTPDTRDTFHLEQYDYIIDAIDSLKDKVDLILTATSLKGVKFYSSMGAALKVDPTGIRVDEFWDIQYDPLARAIRKRFKRDKRFPNRKFKCVYSKEVLENRGGVSSETCDYKVQINGTIAHVTAIFGFTLAGLVIQDVYESTISPTN